MALVALRWAVSAAFLLVAALATARWLRHRRSISGFLVLALGLLTAVTLDGSINSLLQHPMVALSFLALVCFSGSALALLWFRHTLVPTRDRLLWASNVATALVIAAAAVGIVVWPTNSRLNSAIGIAAATLWMILVVDPVVRLWIAARNLPAVQRGRLRALSLGLGALIIIILLVLVASPLTGNANDLVAVATNAAVLGVIPVLFISFSPPAWMRRHWRESEEQALRQSVTDLVLFSPDRVTLARRALRWAVRLIGAECGAILDEHGEILAVHGMAETDPLLTAVRSAPPPQHATVDPQSGAVVVGLHLHGGEGILAMQAGRFTPLFGDDELWRVEQYAINTTVALDRVELTEKMQRTQAQLRIAREEAEKASQAKNEHLSRMSHELRTPMSAILGYAELLEMRNPRRDQQEPLHAITRAGNHLLNLINDVLDISRLESAGTSLSLEPLRLEELVSETWELTEHEASHRHIRFRMVGDGTTTVMGDRQRLKQVILNLLSNAVKYNREDGSIAVSLQPHDNRVRLSVTDRGPGIDRNQLPRLFTPFDRLGAEKTTVEGTGLGLALSKRLIEAMGGQIGVESAAGEGSTFWIELPLSSSSPKEEDEITQSGVATVPRWKGRKKVLYVEDNLPNVTLMEEILELRPQVQMITALQGSRAIEIARDQRPDLVLLDLHLPDVSGDEVLRRLRQFPETAAIPVVIISADATDKQVSRLLQLGAEAYITKPLKVRQFLDVLDSALGDDDVATPAPLTPEPSTTNTHS